MCLCLYSFGSGFILGMLGCGVCKCKWEWKQKRRWMDMCICSFIFGGVSVQLNSTFWCLSVLGFVCWVFVFFLCILRKSKASIFRSSKHVLIISSTASLPTALNHSPMIFHVTCCTLVVNCFSFTTQETIAADDVLQDSTPLMPSTNNKEALDKER